MGNADIPHKAVVGLVLAGGHSSRFGSEKAMALLEGEPLIARAVSKLQATVDLIAVSARPESGVAQYAAGANLTVVHDVKPDQPTPLCGVYSGLLWARDVGATGLITLPCDVPMVPVAALRQLLLAKTGTKAAVLSSPRGIESLCALWPVAYAPALLWFTNKSRHLPIHKILQLLGSEIVNWKSAKDFENVNTVGDLTDIERRLSAFSAKGRSGDQT